jgi:hypothetical protein
VNEAPGVAPQLDPAFKKANFGTGFSSPDMLQG